MMKSNLFTILFFSLISFSLLSQEIPAVEIDSNKIPDKIYSKKSIPLDSIHEYILNSIDSIQEVYIHGSSRVNLIKTDTLFVYDSILIPVDSISFYWSDNLFDSITILLDNSIKKLFANNSKIKTNRDSISLKYELESPKLISEKVHTPKDDKILWILTILISTGILFVVTKKYLKHKKSRNSLKEVFSSLKSQSEDLTRKPQDFKNKTNESDNLTNKQVEEIRKKVIKSLTEQNALDNSELKELSSKKENRWVTVGHSAIGRSHSNAIPPILCQDNHHFENLNETWQLAIVCDGAGSAKMSHFGSELISKSEISNNLSEELFSYDWFKKGTLPSKKEWSTSSISILEKTYNNLSAWVEKQNKETGTAHSVNDFATTVMFVLYNSKGALVANIGDGRGGYLNDSGDFKSLFVPYGGDESNGTIFITSPIWDTPELFIQSDVVNEKILSIFLLSDGMEKITFECSNLTEEVFIDANIPFKKFFYPILSKISSLDIEGERKLIVEWKNFIENGNEAIRNESDDKTLLISFLK